MSASCQSIALEYELTEQALASFVGEAVSRARLYKWFWLQWRFALGLLFLIAVIVVGMLFVARPWWDDVQTRLTVCAVFGFVVLLALILDPLFARWTVRWRIHRGPYRIYLQRIRLEVDPPTIRATSLSSGETWEWKALYDIKFMGPGATIYVGRDNALLLPKRLFATDVDFMAFLGMVNKLPRVPAA